MYFSHHYAVDLVAGSIAAAVAFFVARGKFLPRTQPGKMFRWDYDFVEVGEVPEEEQGYAYGLAGAGLLGMLDEEGAAGGGGQLGDSDEWTIGSSSSFSSASRDAGMRSPTTEDDGWEGDTLASASDHE